MTMHDGKQYTETEGDLNLDEVTHEPNLSITQKEEDKDMSFAENGHKLKNSECHCNVGPFNTTEAYRR